MSKDSFTALEAARPELHNDIRERVRRELLAELAAAMPQTAERAGVACHAALLRWRALADTAVEAATAFYNHDRLGAELRIVCTEQLQKDELGPVPPPQGDETFAAPIIRKAMTYTQADKAASAHPLYTAHKAKAQQLGAAKAAAENAAEQAHETLLNMREYLRTFIAAAQVLVIQPPTSRPSMG